MTQTERQTNMVVQFSCTALIRHPDGGTIAVLRNIFDGKYCTLLFPPNSNTFELSEGKDYQITLVELATK